MALLPLTLQLTRALRSQAGEKAAFLMADRYKEMKSEPLLLAILLCELGGSLGEGEWLIEAREPFRYNTLTLRGETESSDQPL